jgi:rhamnose utilization protein RhaD (predicted bifunctional aldolase and dehydrogenase)
MLIHDELIRFESLSKFCGERFDLVQAGGGNTSVKHHEWMFIKSSGINMSNITPFNGYSVINNCLVMDDISSNNIKDIMSYNVIGKRRGSIETFMHSFLKKYTVHLHPIQTNRILISKDAIEVIRRLFPDALCIDYFTPGIILCNEIRQNYNNEKIIFLKNHGKKNINLLIFKFFTEKNFEK